MSDTYATLNRYGGSSKENLSKSFEIHQRDEQQQQESNDLSKTVFENQSVDTQTLDLQVKSIMVQLIPYVIKR